MNEIAVAIIIFPSEREVQVSNMLYTAGIK